ncbi:tRNA modification GTPase MnmE [Clostridia bacterium]|nr:tRNA modification GTPase MnmE [Clostridia bacterium]
MCDRIFKGNKKIAETAGYTCVYGAIFDDEMLVDDCIATVFRSPKSYTGEDTVEISCHGSIAVTQKILRLLLKKGAILAKAGEFTRRAFENGKLSLLEAETVAEIISAENENELRIANSLRSGATYSKIITLKDKILDICAELAVWADYPDDNDFGNDYSENLVSVIEKIANELDNLLKTYDYGRQVKNGIKTVIIGKPNVGKSSLMNALIGYERSIVTEIAGTTRDIVEEKINLGPVTLNLSDTAGIRQTYDKIEKIGVELSRNAIDHAELILAVFDISKFLTDEDFVILDSLKNKKVIYVLNKSDLKNISKEVIKQVKKQIGETSDIINISAKNGEISALCEKITKMFETSKISIEGGIIANERQKEALSRALCSLIEAKSSLQNGFTLDIVSVLLDESCDFLLELIGEKITDEVADRVFQKFCVGK